jgi:hypothetical protein
MNEIITMGGSATLGFVFQHIAELTKAAHARRMEEFDAQELSMQTASNRSGKLVRRGIYFIVAFSFIGIMIAGFFGKPVILEYELERKFLFFEWTVVKLKQATGVVMLEQNRTAFLAMVSFLFGKGAR